MHKYQSALEALAVGDALGMPTEFMTREYIKQNFGFVSSIIDPQFSLIHKNLARASITDDTEQNLYLIETYCGSGKITIENTVDGLLSWIKESGADRKGYIGPSSMKALKAIEDGEDPLKAGLGATTCGAPMRAPAAALCSISRCGIELAEDIYRCSVPTHNTSSAMEAAMAIGFAVKAAVEGEGMRNILKAASEGMGYAAGFGVPEFAGPSTLWRTRYFTRALFRCSDIEEILDTLYFVNGTGLQAYEVVPAVLTIFSKAKEDVWLAIRMGASVGGDTDTIAALAGLLSTLYAGEHNIPRQIVEDVVMTNRLDLSRYASLITKRQQMIP